MSFSEEQQKEYEEMNIRQLKEYRELQKTEHSRKDISKLAKKHVNEFSKWAKSWSKVKKN